MGDSHSFMTDFLHSVALVLFDMLESSRRFCCRNAKTRALPERKIIVPAKLGRHAHGHAFLLVVYSREIIYHILGSPGGCLVLSKGRAVVCSSSGLLVAVV